MIAAIYNAAVPSFKENLVRLRKDFGVTQTALADALGVSQKQVNEWEQGRAQPQLSNFGRISRFFGVTVLQLRGDEPLPDRIEPPQKAEPAAPPRREVITTSFTSRDELRRQVQAIAELLDDQGLARMYAVAQDELDRVRSAPRDLRIRPLSELPGVRVVEKSEAVTSPGAKAPPAATRRRGER